LAVRLFIGNLSYDATEAELREHFAAIGQPSQVVLPIDRETGRPRGFAFVEFADRAMAEDAIRRLNGQAFKGRPLAVSEARPREERGPSGPRPPDSFGPRPPRTLDAGGMPVLPPMARPNRSFGPPAPSKRENRGGNRGRQKSEGPKGPIKERPGGRFYTVDTDDGSDEPLDFENFATSAPDGDEQQDDE
jgi:RNA recognition motif-containing protein